MAVFLWFGSGLMVGVGALVVGLWAGLGLTNWPWTLSTGSPRNLGSDQRYSNFKLYNSKSRESNQTLVFTLLVAVITYIFTQTKSFFLYCPKALREAFKNKNKIQNLNFFQIGPDPPPSKFEPEFLRKKISNWFWLFKALYIQTLEIMLFCLFI